MHDTFHIEPKEKILDRHVRQRHTLCRPGALRKPRTLPKAADLSLTVFTLLAQSAVGLTVVVVAGHWIGGVLEAETHQPTAAPALGLICASLLAALGHLAAPRRAPHALCNPRTSWLSREVLLISVFATALALAEAAAWTGASRIRVILEIAALVSGCAALWAMTGVYLQKTIPAWNSPATPLEFTGSALLLGGMLAIVSLSAGNDAAEAGEPVFWVAASSMSLGLFCKLAAIPAGAAAEHAARSQVWYLPPATALSAGRARLARALSNTVGVVLVLLASPGGGISGVFIGLAAIIASEVAGRLRFYRLYSRLGL